MSHKWIAVTGATGQQGGAVARKLLERGWQVRALTRDPNKSAAQELKALGAEVIPGDMENRSELDAAFNGAHGVFSVQNFWLPEVGFDGEIRQGKLVADAAKAAGVQHLVYSSVGAAHRGMGQKHFESKWIVEQYIHSLDIPFTILRPSWFMDNLNWGRPYILNGTLTGNGLEPGKTLQAMAVEDVGVFAEKAFDDPKAYLGKTLELAGDELTEMEMASILEKVIGRPVTLTAPTSGWGNATEEEMQAVHAFFNGEGFSADISTVRKLHPGLLRFEAYLRRNGWENQQPIPEAQAWG